MVLCFAYLTFSLSNAVDASMSLFCPARCNDRGVH